MTETRLVEQDAAVPPRNVRESLHAVIDPELGIDIVNLGMVYEVAVTGGAVVIELTLTTPGCPLHASITADIRNVLLKVPGVGSVSVNLVWTPPWTPDAMSDQAKRMLGFAF